MLNEKIHNGDVIRIILHSPDINLLTHDFDFHLIGDRAELTIGKEDFTPEYFDMEDTTNVKAYTVLISKVPYKWTYKPDNVDEPIPFYLYDETPTTSSVALDVTGRPLEYYDNTTNTYKPLVTVESYSEGTLTVQDKDGNSFTATKVNIPSTCNLPAGMYRTSVEGTFGTITCEYAITSSEQGGGCYRDLDVEIACDPQTLAYGLIVHVTDYFLGISQARYINYKTRITMTQTIIGNAPFQVPTDSFSISESAQTYTIQASVNYDWQTHGANATWEDLTEVTAGDMFMASLMTPGLTYRLYGNTSTVTLKY